MYYLDVTDIAIYVETETSISGIQRVSFEVIKRLVERYGTEMVRLSYWDRSHRVYVSIASDFIADMKEFDSYTFSSVFFGRKARSFSDTAPTLNSYRNTPLKYRIHFMVRNYNALRGNEAHFKKRNSSIAEWLEYRAGSIKSQRASEAVENKRISVSETAKKDDYLIILGATWSIDGLSDCFQHLKNEYGMNISQTVHDLIPIIMPEHVAGDFSQEFYRWLKTSAGYCTRYFTDSKSTGRDLARFMEEVGVIRPINVVPLAQKFSVITSTPPKKDGLDTYEAKVDLSLNIRKKIHNLSKLPFVLVVGTMESRKNLWRLAQAWQRLSYEKNLDIPRLIFAGKPGWYNDDFNQFMSATGNLAGWVQFADKPTDTELAFLYEKCVFTAMVSLYEGWGLPIGESLSFGKTAVVAHNSSMPEVGGDLVEYCDAHSISSIYDACHKLISDLDHRHALESKIAKAHLRTWDDVTDDLLAAMAETQSEPLGNINAR